MASTAVASALLAAAAERDRHELELLVPHLTMADLCKCMRVCSSWRGWLLAHPEVFRNAAEKENWPQAVRFWALSSRDFVRLALAVPYLINRFGLLLVTDKQESICTATLAEQAAIHGLPVRLVRTEAFATSELVAAGCCYLRVDGNDTAQLILSRVRNLRSKTKKGFDGALFLHASNIDESTKSSVLEALSPWYPRQPVAPLLHDGSDTDRVNELAWCLQVLRHVGPASTLSEDSGYRAYQPAPQLLEDDEEDDDSTISTPLDCAPARLRLRSKREVRLRTISRFRLWNLLPSFATLQYVLYFLSTCFAVWLLLLVVAPQQAQAAADGLAFIFRWTITASIHFWRTITLRNWSESQDSSTGHGSSAEQTVDFLYKPR